MAEDHALCKQLAHGMADYPQIEIDADRVVTNILIFRVRNSRQEPLTETETESFLEKAREHGVLMGQMGGGIVRAVTHYGIEESHINAALIAIRRALIDMQL
jgi:threonine aldolase